MAKLVGIAALLALSACVSGPGDSPGEMGGGWPTLPPDAAMALSVWPGPVGRCEDEVSEVGIREVTRENLYHHCRRSDVDACYLGTARMNGGAPRPWIVIADDLPEFRADEIAELRAHELVHWLHDCSGVGRGDEQHGTELWADALEGIRVAMWASST